MELLLHHNISDLYKTLGLPVEHQIDFTIHSIPEIHPHIPFKSTSLRADYFSFILTKQGSGIYYLDDNKFTFGPRSIYFTNPGHLKSYELNESVEAYIFMLTEKFLHEHVQSDIYIEFPFLLAEIVPPKGLSETDLHEFEKLYLQILTEFKKDSIYRNKIIGNLFLILLLKIKEKFWLNYNPIEEGNRSSEIVRSFKRLLEVEFNQVVSGKKSDGKLQAQYFAEKLGLHPNYLNSVIKSKTGKTVYDWISSRTVSIAKTLLLNTSYSSKEIAYRLGFSEPTHFSRFFSKHTEVSPGEFRKAAKSNRKL
jgi:AraC family transcriptional regulator, transcriptional activator of pobA